MLYLIHQNEKSNQNKKFDELFIKMLWRRFTMNTNNKHSIFQHYVDLRLQMMFERWMKFSTMIIYLRILKTNFKNIEDKMKEIIFKYCVIIFVLIVDIFNVFRAFEKKIYSKTMKEFCIELFYNDNYNSRYFECFFFWNC